MSINSTLLYTFHVFPKEGNGNLSLVLFPALSLSLYSFPFAFMANARLSVSYPSLFDFSLSFKQSAVVWKGRQKISCLFPKHCLQNEHNGAFSSIQTTGMEPFFFNNTTI